MEIPNNIIFREVFKTGQFFINKKHEKKNNLREKTDAIFNSIANQIEKSKKRDIIDKKLKKVKNEKIYQKRKNYKHYFYFILSENSYKYKQIFAAEFPTLKLENNQHILRQDNSGFYRGELEKLLILLDSFYTDI